MDGYQRISNYKSQLMGISVMIVVYGHLLYYHSGLMNYEDLNFTIWYTLGSVEMFMFVSGFGIYHSLKKNRDAYGFYWRRLSRLLPSFLPVMLVWCVAGMLKKGMTVGQAMGNLTGLGWWLQQDLQFNWYVPAILILYLLSPLFFDCIERKQSGFVFAALALLIVAGWRSNLLMAITRFPTYFLGMYFGARHYAGEKPTRGKMIAWTVAGAVAMAIVPYFFLVGRKYLWYYGMYWIPFFFVTPACAFGLTWLMERQTKNTVGQKINRIWGFLGVRSFEIYLCHLAFYELCLALDVQGWLRWIIIAAVGTVIGICYYQVVQWALSWWGMRKRTGSPVRPGNMTGATGK